MKLVTFLKRWIIRRLNHLLDNYRRQRKIRYCDKKIAKLEREYQYLLSSSTHNAARLSLIVSELGKLWNSKFHAEGDKELAKWDGPSDIWQLQKAVNKIVLGGKKKMAKARSDEEIHIAFKEGLYKIKTLIDE